MKSISPEALYQRVMKKRMSSTRHLPRAERKARRVWLRGMARTLSPKRGGVFSLRNVKVAEEFLAS